MFIRLLVFVVFATVVRGTALLNGHVVTPSPDPSWISDPFIPGGAGGVDRYYGIRYSNTPVRFQAQSTPLTPWLPSAPFTASTVAPACLQTSVVRRHCAACGAFALASATGAGSSSQTPFPMPPSYTPGVAIPPAEDCLFLNVFTPFNAGSSALSLAQAALTGLPVLVNIHGGLGTYGEGYGFGRLQYDGKPFTDQGIILVTLNYRLGHSAFMATNALFTEDNLNVGLYGFTDQQLALQWVQDNIHGFGGNRNRVTLMGESAGGSYTQLHMSAATSAPLFSQAIIQHSYLYTMMRSLAVSQADGHAQIDFETNGGSCDVACDGVLAEGAACITCIRGLSLVEFKDQFSEVRGANEPVAGALGFPAGGRVPGPVYHALGQITVHPRHLVKTGLLHNKPVMAGDNQQEGTVFVFVPLISPPMGTGPTNFDGASVAEYTEFMPYIIETIMGFPVAGPQTAVVTAMYPCLTPPTVPTLEIGCYAALHRLWADGVFSCPIVELLDALADKPGGRFRTYGYRFNIQPWWFQGLGATHTFDLYFVWNNFRLISPVGSTPGLCPGGFQCNDPAYQAAIQPGQRAAGAVINQAWANFVKTGRPYAVGQPRWPLYREGLAGSKGRRIVLKEGTWSVTRYPDGLTCEALTPPFDAVYGP